MEGARGKISQSQQKKKEQNGRNSLRHSIVYKLCRTHSRKFLDRNKNSGASQEFLICGHKLSFIGVANVFTHTHFT